MESILLISTPCVKGQLAMQMPQSVPNFSHACMHAWLKFGTDCGICIASCPFTQGVDIDRIDAMKGHPEIMREILREDAEKYGSRACNPDPLPIAEV